jgi:hypothetical protein
MESLAFVNGLLIFAFYAVVFAVIAGVLAAVIRGAVRTALDDHQRKMLWYEATGLWYAGKPPKGLPGAAQLTRAERKGLPKDERPEKGS